MGKHTNSFDVSVTLPRLSVAPSFSRNVPVRDIFVHIYAETYNRLLSSLREGTRGKMFPPCLLIAETCSVTLLKKVSPLLARQRGRLAKQRNLPQKFANCRKDLELVREKCWTVIPSNRPIRRYAKIHTARVRKTSIGETSLKQRSRRNRCRKLAIVVQTTAPS